MSKELLFNNLLERALKDWPETLELELQTQICVGVEPTNKGYELVRYKDLPWDGSKDSYIVKNLYDNTEKICGKYDKHYDEILFCNLHDSIYFLIRDIAYYTLSFKLSSIRPEPVKAIYHDKLKDYLGESPQAYGWPTQNQIDLVRKYFEVNGVSV